MCKRVCAQTLHHERQGRTLDQILTSNARIICVGCCSMLCNCTEGLHFCAFHYMYVECAECVGYPLSNGSFNG